MPVRWRRRRGEGCCSDSEGRSCRRPGSWEPETGVMLLHNPGYLTSSVSDRSCPLTKFDITAATRGCRGVFQGARKLRISRTIIQGCQGDILSLAMIRGTEKMRRVRLLYCRELRHVQGPPVLMVRSPEYVPQVLPLVAEGRASSLQTFASTDSFVVNPASFYLLHLFFSSLLCLPTISHIGSHRYHHDAPHRNLVFSTALRPGSEYPYSTTTTATLNPQIHPVPSRRHGLSGLTRPPPPCPEVAEPRTRPVSGTHAPLRGRLP